MSARAAGVLVLALATAFAPACAAPSGEGARAPAAPMANAKPGDASASDPAARIRRALAAVDVASYRADIAHLEGERNASSPEHLAEASAYVERALTACGFTVTRQPASRATPPGENLVADRGDAGAPVVAASAHLDTVYGSPGADDNASGIATLLAIARASRDLPTKKAIRLLAFDLEERGMVGSTRYVKELAPAERRRIVALYNFDMVAFTRRGPGSQTWPERADLLADMRGRPLPENGDFIGAFGVAGGEHRPMRALLEARAYVSGLAIATMELPSLFLKLAPDLARGDHAPFWEAGIPAVVLGDTAEFRNPNYHRPSDTLATLDLEFATRVARLAAATVLLAAEVR